jgi:hypothetical protein
MTLYAISALTQGVHMMKIQRFFGILSAGLMVWGTSAQASTLSCQVSAARVDGTSTSASVSPIPTYVPANAGPGFLEARPTLSLGKDYEVQLVVRIGTQIDASKPVSEFNDYSVWYRYVVYKLGDGKKRAVASRDVGEITATDSKSELGCNATVCAVELTSNVDVATLLGNLPNEISPYDAYKQGLIPGSTPGGFVIDCDWYL